MARTKTPRTLFPPAEATAEAPTSPGEEPFPSPIGELDDLVDQKHDNLTEEERQLNAIEAQRSEIFGTVESKLKVALSDACAHLKLLNKLGINGVLARKDFAEYRKVLFIGKAFGEAEEVSAATAPKVKSPKAPKAPRAPQEPSQKPSLTTTEAILEALSDGSQMDILSITAKVAYLTGGQATRSPVGQGLFRLKRRGKIVSLERGMYSIA
jgi:hypothetical protein